VVHAENGADPPLCVVRRGHSIDQIEPPGGTRRQRGRRVPERRGGQRVELHRRHVQGEERPLPLPLAVEVDPRGRDREHAWIPPGEPGRPLEQGVGKDGCDHAAYEIDLVQGAGAAGALLKVERVGRGVDQQRLPRRPVEDFRGGPEGRMPSDVPQRAVRRIEEEERPRLAELIQRRGVVDEELGGGLLADEGDGERGAELRRRQHRDDRSRDHVHLEDRSAPLRQVVRIGARVDDVQVARLERDVRLQVELAPHLADGRRGGERLQPDQAPLREGGVELQVVDEIDGVPRRHRAGPIQRPLGQRQRPR